MILFFCRQMEGIVVYSLSKYERANDLFILSLRQKGRSMTADR